MRCSRQGQIDLFFASSPGRDPTVTETRRTLRDDERMSLAQRSDVEERKAVVRKRLGVRKETTRSCAIAGGADSQRIRLDELEGRDVSSDDLCAQPSK